MEKVLEKYRLGNDKLRKYITLFLILFSFHAFAQDADIQPTQQTQEVESTITDSPTETGKKIRWFELFENARDKFANKVRTDLKSFFGKLAYKFEGAWQQVEVGLYSADTKINMAFMNSMSRVSIAIYDVFIPFMNAMIIALFILWLYMESWAMWGFGGDNDYWGLGMRITKKVVTVIIWMWILNHNPMQLFLWFATPIISLAAGMSDSIINTTASITGMNVSEISCDTIYRTVARQADMLVDKDYVASILCMTHRIGGLMYEYVGAGIKWVIEGIGSSFWTFLVGLAFIGIFTYNIWKFSINVMGAVIDLFFVLIFLPFTAMNECFSGDTKYNGMWKPIWDGFVNFIKGSPLKSQVMKFINAAIYFIVLAVISAICIGLLSAINPSYAGDSMSVLLVGILVSYLLSKADEFAKTMGAVDTEWGDKISGYVKNAGSKFADWAVNKFKNVKGK